MAPCSLLVAWWLISVAMDGVVLGSFERAPWVARSSRVGTSDAYQHAATSLLATSSCIALVLSIARTAPRESCQYGGESAGCRRRLSLDRAAGFRGSEDGTFGGILARAHIVSASMQFDRGLRQLFYGGEVAALIPVVRCLARPTQPHG